MAQAPVVEVQGVNKLARALKDFTDELADLKAAHQRAAELVLRAAQSRTPRITGRLAGSLRIGKGTRAALVREGTAKVPYAGAVEFGAWPKGRSFVKEGRYLFPAAKDHEAEVADIYESAIGTLAARF